MRDCLDGGASILEMQMTEVNRIRILIVDDHPLVQEGLAAIIQYQPDMAVAGLASCTREALRRFRESTPDVTLMDLELPDGSGIDAMICLQSEFPDARVIVLTTFSGDMEIRRALEAGAYGYFLKSIHPRELLDAIRQVHTGKKMIPPEIAAHLAEPYSEETLTVREVEVLRQVAGGSRNRDIAERLVIAEETVKAHLKNIMAKLGAIDRTQAVAIGLRRGIIQV
jgi:DNA-binding NarL/FixJ family response regulator